MEMLVDGNNFSQHVQERPPCQPGFYCPLGSFSPIPCLKGSYGPTAGGVSKDSCLECPPHHYCPRPGLSAPMPCGPVAQQVLSGQDTCVCPGVGQSFQASDGRCLCTLGYQPTNTEDGCVHKLYGVCRDGNTRTQYGDCLDRYQWSLHCRQQVCQSAEDYQGYDGELGLCVCREPPGRAACGGLCRSRLSIELKLQCQSSGKMELVWSYGSQVLSISSGVLETVFKQWDSQGTLLCNSHLNSAHPVHIVQTTEAGFYGVLSGTPKVLQQLFSVTKLQGTQSSAEVDSDVLWEVPEVENISHGGTEINSSSSSRSKSDIKEEVRETGATEVLNPTTCLHLVCADTLEEFWDYENQVDLEAFSSNTFYSLLLKQSLSVTTRLGQLSTEVKELYQGVLGKLQLLHPRLITEERMGEGYERMRREVEKEVVRRKSLASQLRTLLDSFETRAANPAEGPQCVHSSAPLAHRLTSLVDEMGELVSAECQRQGAWWLLGEGTGAKLLCPDTGAVLTKDYIFGPDGDLRVCQAVHCDSVTGLTRTNAHSHMLLSSGHTMAVPPDFFLHPQTGRVLPIAGNVAYDPASSTLVFTTDSCTGDNRKWDSPLLPFIPYPTSCHSDQPLPSTQLRGLRPGQRLELGAPMADADTGVPVPILAVTIHPQTGLVYPLGGVHVCPLTRLLQPIQIGYPMLEPRTGDIVLTVGVSLDPVTGAVLPVGGVLLGETFTEPLSGRMVRVGGASIRAGQVVPAAGGYQTLLDNKGSERGSGRQDLLSAAAKELQQAWGRSLHCQLQLQTRVEILLDWAVCLQQDGGILGEMPLSGSDMCVPALLGMEYPDPMGSGLSVPVLGCQTDLMSGIITPLAGTMEDPDGKGTVKNKPRAEVEALQREVCARNIYWQQQRQREEDILSDLDSALFQCLFGVSEDNSYQVQWSGRQLREAAVELQDSAQTETQRRAAQCSHLALILPPHILHILTLGDEKEWDQQCVWHSELLSGLNKDRELRQRELWEQCCSRQTDLEAALNVLHFVRHISQLRADTAQAVLCGNFWYKEYGLVQCSGHRPTVRVMDVLQQKALPLLERLNQLLEDKHPASFSPNTCRQHISGLSTKQAYGMEIASRVWTASVPVVKGISTQSLREPGKAQSQDTGLQGSSAPTHNLTRHTTSSGIHSQEKEWSKLLELSPLFQLLKDMELQLKCWAFGEALIGGKLEGKKSFVDVLDAQWECEGELIPLEPSILNPREFLVYQHGLFLMHTLHSLKLTPTISLQIAAGLPNNNYFNNAFRNSFFYQEAEETLFVRRQRLQSVGGFSLLLLHCLSHIKIKEMSSDSSPAFQRLFFKVLQACLSELFQARLSVSPSRQESNLHVWFQDQEAPLGDFMGNLSGSHATFLLHRLHKPSRGLLSQDVRTEYFL
ncbi:hypothetical protein PAMP_018747 [Pampus punctatissimus]